MYNSIMDMIIDASCIIAVLTEEPEREKVLKMTEGANLISPACLPYEVGNSFSAMIKRNRIDGNQAVSAYKIFEKFPIRLVEPDIKKAVEIAAAEKHYAYDVYYIVCALDMGLPLYSLDNGLIEIAKKRGVKCL